MSKCSSCRCRSTCVGPNVATQPAAGSLVPHMPGCHHNTGFAGYRPEYIPLKKRRQLEEQQRLARLGRAAPQPASSADTGSGGSRGYISEPEVGHRQKESLLVMKAKALQEVSHSWEKHLDRHKCLLGTGGTWARFYALLEDLLSLAPGALALSPRLAALGR